MSKATSTSASASTSTGGSDAPAVVDRLLRRAREIGASDLHLDPDEEGLLVRARRDGALEVLERLPPALSAPIVGRLKALADLLVYRTDVPQEGRIPAARSPIALEVRVATYPALFGERAALRLDAPGAAALDLAGLGLAPGALADLRRAADRREGAILLTGPSGSGKTTTLYALVRYLASGDELGGAPQRVGWAPRSIFTIEDPIERRIAGITQTQVSPAAGLTFARALRSLLRQDPEVILIGEIRDRETAAIALEAALTGHLVASTVHAGTAPAVFARLLDMGVEPFVLTTAVRGVLGQRLLRRPGGAGRRLVAEWLPVGPEMRRAIQARGDGEALAEAARAAGFKTIREEAEALARAGEVAIEEVERVFGADA